MGNRRTVYVSIPIVILCLLLLSITTVFYFTEYTYFTSMRTLFQPKPTLKPKFYAKSFLVQGNSLKLFGSYSDGEGRINATDFVIVVDEVKHFVSVLKNLSHATNHASEQFAGKHLADIFESEKSTPDGYIDRKEDEKYFIRNRNVPEVSCRNIFDGNQTELKKAEDIAKTTQKSTLTESDYINMTKDCEKFRKERGYIMSPLTHMEENFPIAFSLLLFKDVGQAERLLRAVYRPQNLYCIHVDEKSPEDMKKAVHGIASCFDNIFLTPRSFDVQWGTMTVLEPELLCMNETWEKSKKWKYFINLTGQEFLLKTNYELVQILQAYDGANDVEGIIKRANTDRWQKAGPPPHNITAIKGAVHVIVNRDFVDYVIHNPIAQDFLNWSRNVVIPDETFFASLNHNPQLGIRGSYKGESETDPILKPYMCRFKNWGAGMFNWPCHGMRVRLICVFGVGDLPLLYSRPELFANKFYWNYQHFAFDCMEELIYNRTRDEFFGTLTFDPTFYRNVGFVQNKIS
ncbi:hypothetical protein ACJMK2_026770 [Sinanodonta woodiana]|uniref:Beta-1,3-galactosyl-O-glycosyl-glycoprotein beta-1,6-N-acetylglucosaminyltransferase n=1 Tax=Sinanodonta woodiana TaxID=1069815 RepID=A0ABD3XKT8_SINWO